MELRTARLLLRPFVLSDGPALHGYLSQSLAVAFEPYGTMTADECDRLAAERAADERFLAVCLLDGGLVGNLFVAPEGPERLRTWTIGYVLNPDHWGHGYATEAVAALLEHLFTDRGAHRVVARCDPRNERSWLLLERVGMRREAHLLQAESFVDGPDGLPVWHDTFQYAVLERERQS